MFWFFAVYICISEAFCTWLALVCPSLKKNKPASPFIFMTLLCRVLKICIPWAGLLSVNVQLVLPIPQELTYLQVLAVGILWIVIDTSHLKWCEENLTTAFWLSATLTLFFTNTSGGSRLPAPAWLVSCFSARTSRCGCNRWDWSSEWPWPFQKVIWSVLNVWCKAELSL